MIENKQTQDVRSGVLAALAAYVMWGFFPLLFRALDGVNLLLIISHRVVWSLLFVAMLLGIWGRLGEVKAAFSDRSAMVRLGFATLMLTGNWLVYVWAVNAEQVLQASFGYFINPLFSVALGMAFLGERQNRWQMVAIGIAFVAVIVQWVGIGDFPWVAFALAILFAAYGFLRKTVSVGSAPGLMVETILMLPFAVGFLVYTSITQGAGPYADLGTMLWLVSLGPATAGALLFFAYAARNLRLTTIGMFQYIGPSIQFLIAIYLFREPLNGLQLFSFVLIWVSLIVFSVDGLRNRARNMEAANG